jgi:hypothetical protein
VSRQRLVSVIALLAVGVVWTRRAEADEPTKQECVVANETAQDLQRSGKLVEAQAQLLTCAASACPTAVRLDCADRLQSVEQALPTVVFTPRDAGGGDTSAVSLAVDGVVQSASLDGTPVAVDPGTHTFTLILAGRAPVLLRLALKKGDRVRREVVFEATGGTAGASSEGELGGGSVGAQGSAQASAVLTRRIGWAAIGAGAAGMTLGTVFGFVALGRRVSLGKACNGSECPDGQEDTIESMHVNAVASNVSFAIGVLGLAAGGVLLFAFPQGFGGGAARDEAGLVVRPWAGLGNLGFAGKFR